MIPANPDLFNKQLEAIRFPKEDIHRTPLLWILPMKDFKEDEECSEEFATRQALDLMMGQIKLLQKLESDRLLTIRLLPFNEKEEEEWLEAKDKLISKMLENFSIIEIIKDFPQYTKIDDKGKVIFDIDKFKHLLCKDKDGNLFCDEYQIELENEKNEKTRKNYQEEHKKKVEEEKKIIEDCEKNDTVEIDLLKDSIQVEPKETLEHWGIDIEDEDLENV